MQTTGASAAEDMAINSVDETTGKVDDPMVTNGLTNNNSRSLHTQELFVGIQRSRRISKRNRPNNRNRKAKP